MKNRIVNNMFLQCSPPLEVILSRMEARIIVLLQSDFSPTIIFLKKDYEDLIRCLNDKIII